MNYEKGGLYFLSSDHAPVCAEEFPNRANFDACTRQATFAVKSFQPDACGPHNMHGNVWEWVEDCVHENYAGAPGSGDPWLDENAGICEKRVLRSGARDVEGIYIHSAHGNINNWIENGYDTIGFEVVRE